MIKAVVNYMANVGYSEDKVTEEMPIDILKNEKNSYIRQAAAFREAASEDVLLKAVGDTNYVVRVYALHNQNATARIFTAAAERVRGEQPTQQTRQINDLVDALQNTRRQPETVHAADVSMALKRFDPQGLVDVTDFTKTSFRLGSHTYPVVYQNGLEDPTAMAERAMKESVKMLDPTKDITFVILEGNIGDSPCVVI